MTARRIIILGATSGMAEALARIHASEGASLVLVGRHAERLEALARDLRARGAAEAAPVTTDLASPEQPEKLLAAWSGGAPVQAVYLFYGVLGDQVRAEADLDHVRDVLQVNFSSAALWCMAAANLLEAQGGGALVVLGSVAGDRGRQSNYVYGAAKAGLGVLVQGIAHRFALRGSGARAVLIKPGFVDTAMTDHLEKGGPLWARPDKVAGIIRKAAEAGGPIVYAPGFWRLIMLIIRVIPAPIFHKRPL